MEYSKGLGHDNSLSVQVASYTTIYNTDYYGTFTGRQDLLTNEDALFLKYNHNFGFGLNLWVDLGVSYSMARLNGERVSSDFNPRGNIGFFYRVNEMNELTLSTNLYAAHPSPFTVNNALVQNDEILWLQGNPYLGQTRKTFVILTYSYLPKNWLQLTASAQYTRMRSFEYKYYVPDNLEGMVRTFTDDNTARRLYFTAGATLKLFNNSLMISAEGYLDRERATGYAPKSFLSPRCAAYVAYYLGNFSANFLYMSPEKSLIDKYGEDRHGVTVTTPDYVSAGLSYSFNDFTATLSVKNWINSRHAKVKAETDTPVYSQTYRYLPTGRALGVSLQLTYTIPYGKKVSRDDEVENNARKHSAVLQ